MKLIFHSHGEITLVKFRMILFINLFMVICCIYVIGVWAKGDKETVDIVEKHPEVRVPYMSSRHEYARARAYMDGLRTGAIFRDEGNVKEALRPWERYIDTYAKLYDIDPDLVRAIIYTESRGNPLSISPKGALGLMQIMPGTAEFLGIENAMDPEQNIRGGIRYIAWLLERDLDEHGMLWAWNAGIGTLYANIMPLETQMFIKRVQNIKDQLKNQNPI